MGFRYFLTSTMALIMLLTLPKKPQMKENGKNILSHSLPQLKLDALIKLLVPLSQKRLIGGDFEKGCKSGDMLREATQKEMFSSHGIEGCGQRTGGVSVRAMKLSGEKEVWAVSAGGGVRAQQCQTSGEQSGRRVW